MPLHLGRSSTLTALGLPDHIEACLFDLDGVLTQTAKVHCAAWAQTFNRYLSQRAARTGEPYVPFAGSDYARYVDGRQRYDGVRAFLASRGIALPEGSPDDPPSRETVCGLGNAKNDLVLHLMAKDGVQPYPGSVRYLHACRQAGLRRAVVSASRNAKDVLRAARVAGLLEVVVDGTVAAERGLPGKPSPDTFLAAAECLGVPAERAAVFEDALAGVAAGRSGGFGYVVGVDRLGQSDRLLAAGASIVVNDLEQLLTEGESA